MKKFLTAWVVLSIAACYDGYAPGFAEKEAHRTYKLTQDFLTVLGLEPDQYIIKSVPVYNYGPPNGEILSNLSVLDAQAQAKASLAVNFYFECVNATIFLTPQGYAKLSQNYAVSSLELLLQQSIANEKRGDNFIVIYPAAQP